jgi:hypothetical protein
MAAAFFSHRVDAVAELKKVGPPMLTLTSLLPRGAGVQRLKRFYKALLAMVCAAGTDGNAVDEGPAALLVLVPRLVLAKPRRAEMTQVADVSDKLIVRRINIIESGNVEHLQALLSYVRERAQEGVFGRQSAHAGADCLSSADRRAKQTARAVVKAEAEVNDGRIAQGVQALGTQGRLPDDNIVLQQMRAQFGMPAQEDAAAIEGDNEAARRAFIAATVPAGYMEYGRHGRQRAHALGDGLHRGTAAWLAYLADLRATIQATLKKARGADGLNGAFLSLMLADDDEALELYADLCLLVADGFLPPKAAEALGVSILVPIPKARDMTDEELDAAVARFQDQQDAGEAAPEDPTGWAEDDADLKARGICVPPLLGRIVERLLMRRNAEDIACALGPAQLCITPNASEIITHATTLTLETANWVTAVFDARNGYGEVKMSSVLDHQFEHVPKLTPYNRQLYCGLRPPVAVYYRRDGSTVEFPCAEHLEQGRGLSPANYGFGTAKALSDLRARFPQTAPLAFVDDNRLGGDIPSVAAALRAVYAPDGPYAACGIRPKAGKTKIYCASRELTAEEKALFPDDPDIQFVPPTKGFMLMGVPHGDAAWVRRAVAASMSTRQLPLAPTHLLHKASLQHQLIMTRQVINARPRHLTRQLSARALGTGPACWDAGITKFVERLVGQQLPAAAVKQAQLPMALGGLGLTSLVTIQDEAFLAGWLSVADAIVQKCPVLEPAARAVAEEAARLGNAADDPAGEGADGRPGRSSLLAQDLAGAWRRVTTVAANKALLTQAGGLGRLATEGVQGHATGLQHKLTQAKLQHEFEGLLAAAASADDRARLLGISTKGASAYLQMLPNKEDLVHADDVMRVILAVRLGLDVFATRVTPTCAITPTTVVDVRTGQRRYVEPAEQARLPACGAPLEPKGYHYLGQCKAGTFNPINRHNSILRIIVDVLRSLRVDVVYDGGRPEHHAALDTFMEDNFGRTEGGGKHHRPDAIFTLHRAPMATILDVAVGDFRAKATNRPRGTPLAPGEAALAAEQEKTKQYTSAQRPGQQPKAMAATQLVAGCITNMGAPSTGLTRLLTTIANESCKSVAARAAAGDDFIDNEARGGTRVGRQVAAADMRAVARDADVELHAERTVAHLMARITAVLWREQAHAILAAGSMSAARRYGFGRADVYGHEGRRRDLDLSRAALVWAAQ